MSKEGNVRGKNYTLTILVAMERFNDFINEYEDNIAKEELILSKLNPIETCDDILYELMIRRDAQKKCYKQVFNLDYVSKGS